MSTIRRLAEGAIKKMRRFRDDLLYRFVDSWDGDDWPFFTSVNALMKTRKALKNRRIQEMFYMG